MFLSHLKLIGREKLEHLVATEMIEGKRRRKKTETKDGR